MPAKTVSDAMTRDVVTVRPSESLYDAVLRMRQWGVSGLPVVDGREGLVGIVSEKDLCRVVSESTGSAQPGSLLTLALELGGREGDGLISATREMLIRTHVAQGMSSPAESVSPSDSLEEAARILKKKRINRLPVTEAGKLVGIITRYDLLTRA